MNEIKLAAAPYSVDWPGELAAPAITRSAPTALGLHGIGLSFGGVIALSDIDLAVEPGEIRAVIGPNGAGKSSLLNAICGVYRPDRGRVSIGRHVFAAVPTDRLARLGVARTFQNLALFRGLTVWQNVVVGRAATVRSSLFEQVLGIGRVRSEEAESGRRAAEAIELLHLTALKDEPVATLPYGLQKRVELARALAARPTLLLLDEPMAGLATADKQDMVRFIRAARDEYGTTVVLIEHDIGVVMGLSDRVSVLDYGRKIADGTPAEVRANDAVIDAYLGVAHKSVGAEVAHG